MMRQHIHTTHSLMAELHLGVLFTTSPTFRLGRFFPDQHAYICDKRHCATKGGEAKGHIERKQKGGFVKGRFWRMCPRYGSLCRRSVFCTIVPVFGGVCRSVLFVPSFPSLGSREHPPKAPFLETTLLRTPDHAQKREESVTGSSNSNSIFDNGNRFEGEN